MWGGWKIRFSLAAVSASQPSAAAAAAAAATAAATTNVAAIVVAAAAAAAAVRAKASQWTLFANSTLANALFVEQFRWGWGGGWGWGWGLGPRGAGGLPVCVGRGVCRH
jgi:hypothetical protein